MFQKVCIVLSHLCKTKQNKALCIYIFIYLKFTFKKFQRLYAKLLIGWPLRTDILGKKFTKAIYCFCVKKMNINGAPG